jgi:hypothetical protein
MNHGHVNDLTRSLPQQPVTRRAVLRFLANGAFGGAGAMVGGLLWAVYGVVEMLQPWGQDTVYRDELGYEVVTDALLHWAYSVPGSLALLLTSLSLLGILRRLGLPIGRMSRAARVLASIALALALLSLTGLISSFDPLFTAPRIVGTLALGAATCLAGGEIWRMRGVSGWGIALLAIGLLGLFLLPLWPLVHALAWMPASSGAGFIALYGMGWTLTGSRLRRGSIATLYGKEESLVMDHGHFDALTRSLAGGPESRRMVLRLLAGGALSAAIARFGLTADADAGPRTSKAKTRTDRRHPGAVQSEGKQRKGKGKGKGKKGKGKDKDGPKPSDCGPGKKPCPDGGCVVEALCCPGQRMCAGGRCQLGCCDDEWECGDGSCVASGDCCDDEKPCGGGVCVSADACCPNEKRCQGEVGCFPADEC